MSDRFKKIFLAVCISVPFILYCGYYYGIMIKNAPYKFSEFDHLEFRYGLGDSLINTYNSKTGDYQYLSDDDSLIKTRVKLTENDLLYLHRKAAELGFWNFPKELTGQQNPEASKNPPRYYLQFTYKRKSKSVLFDAEYEQNPKLAQAVRQLIKEVDEMIKEAQARKK